MAVGPEAPEEKVARAHPDTTPSTKRLPSPSRGSPAGPRRPGGSRGAGPCPPCHPPPAPLEARAPSSQRHAAHPPRIIAAVAAFPQNAGLLPLSSPSPHSGVGGGDIFNTAPPPAPQPQRLLPGGGSRRLAPPAHRHGAPLHARPAGVAATLPGQAPRCAAPARGRRGRRGRRGGASPTPPRGSVPHPRPPPLGRGESGAAAGAAGGSPASAPSWAGGR